MNNIVRSLSRSYSFSFNDEDDDISVLDNISNLNNDVESVYYSVIQKNDFGLTLENTFSINDNKISSLYLPPFKKNYPINLLSRNEKLNNLLDDRLHPRHLTFKKYSNIKECKCKSCKNTLFCKIENCYNVDYNIIMKKYKVITKKEFNTSLIKNLINDIFYHLYITNNHDKKTHLKTFISNNKDIIFIPSHFNKFYRFFSDRKIWFS